MNKVSLYNKLVEIEGIFMHHHLSHDELMTSITRIISKIVEDKQKQKHTYLVVILI
jgi:hypothetical protein